MPDQPPIEHQQQLTIGRGGIDPDFAIARGDYVIEDVERFINDLQTHESLYEQVKLSVPIQCADGRTLWVVGGSAIGGSFSLVMGDSLGPRKLYLPNASAKDHATAVYRLLSGKGLPLGTHSDDRAVEENCGCGGQDKLDSSDPTGISILAYIAQNGDEIKAFIEGLIDSETGQNLGIQIKPKDHQLTITNAIDLHERTYSRQPYVTNGRDALSAMEAIGGHEVIEELHGPHREVAAVIDLRARGMVLNRGKLASRYQEKLQAFYINVPSLTMGAEAMYDDQESIRQAFVASLYYNVATAAVLAGPGLRIVCLR